MADQAGGGIDPMGQFEIKPLFGDVLGLFSFTNSTLWMAIGLVVATLIFLIGSSGRAMVPTRMQSLGEIFYEFIRDMVRSTAGEEGLKYFPYIFTIFIFVLLSNVLGLIPYSFTVTSHFAVTVPLALTVFITVTAIGFMKHGMHFLSFFVPSGAPLALKPVLAVIEVISYFVRPLSHSVRLGANMLAGHAVLKVFAGFAYPLAAATGVGFLLPLGAMVGFYAFELLVAVVQAYIFTILTCVYLNDALNMH